MLQGIEFLNIEWLWALLVIPAMVAFYIYRYNSNRANIKLPSTALFAANKTSIKTYLYRGLVGFRMLAIALIIVAMARPQSSSSWQDINTEGIDIVVALDISGSMLAQDLKPDRLEASKNVALDFISARPNDRMGLVILCRRKFYSMSTHNRS